MAAEDDTRLLPLARAAHARVTRGVAYAIASQLGWGMYPVLARSLQAREPSLSIIELIVMMNALCVLTLAIAGAIKGLIASCIRRPHTAATVTSNRTMRWFAITSAFGCTIAARAISNLASAAFAPAHWIVMISLCTPIFTAAIGRFVFHEPMPGGTVAALLGGLTGSAMAIFGGTIEQQSDDSGDDVSPSSNALSPAEAFGVALALLSTVGLAVYQHFVRRTKGMLSPTFILCLNYGVVLVPCSAILGMSHATNPGGSGTNLIADVAALNARQWTCLLSLSVGVYIGAMQLQLLAIRLLGPTLLAAVMPLRLISSVVGSYLLLDERISSPVEAAGLLTVALTASFYLGRQVVVSKRKQMRQQQQDATAPPVGPVASVAKRQEAIGNELSNS